jgi:magnesium-dependent phosphatase-1
MRVTLLSGARDLLETLRDRGILISIASWNDPAPVFEILDRLGLRSFLTAPRAQPHPHKDQMVTDIMRELAGRGAALDPKEILFVDDRLLHLRSVRAAVGPIRTLQAGVDIHDLREVLKHLDS